MKIILFKTESNPANRHADSQHHFWENNRFQAVYVVVGLIAFGAIGSQAAQETYKLFGGHIGGFSSKDDLPGMVKREVGSRAVIADWEDIKKQYGQSEAGLQQFCDRVGLAPNGTACVTVGGKRFWQNERQYYVQRADHKLPEDFLVHEQLQNNLLLLGSWVDAHPVLVRITDYGPSDAVKWAKWDKLLKEANARDISGVYSLVTVDGKQVPAAVDHDGATLQVRAGTFTIGVDGTCRSRMTFVPPSGSETTMEVKATSVRQGLTLRMQWSGAGATTGTVEGNTFTMKNEGMLLVYRK